MLLAAASVRIPGREVVIAHFSHGLRPTADRREAALVKRTAAALGIELIHERGSTRATEAAARDARYAFLADAARRNGAAAVLTAHTQDDQAETLLLRLTRGSGLRGAGAMRELSSRSVGKARITLLRPLLSITRSETLATCAEAGISPAFDGSNRSMAFARNRVRHRVLPELGSVNPRVSTALARFAEAASADDDLLQELARQAVAGSEERGVDRVSWQKETLTKLPSPLLFRVFQDAWQHLQGEEAALTASGLGSAARLIRQPTGGSLTLGGGARLVVEQGRCLLERSRLTVAPFGPIALAVPGETAAGQWLLKTSVITPNAWAPPTPGASDAWRAALDLDRVGPEPCVRPRRVGERFQPLGMAESVRLQDVLLNAKVPRGERGTLPLVAGTGGIAWVAGVRIAEWARVTDQTTRVLLVEARQVR